MINLPCGNCSFSVMVRNCLLCNIFRSICTRCLSTMCTAEKFKMVSNKRTFGCFRKWWYPQIIHFNRVFHYKPSILGYHYFWKHPFNNFDMVLVTAGVFPPQGLFATLLCVMTILSIGLLVWASQIIVCRGLPCYASVFFASFGDVLVRKGPKGICKKLVLSSMHCQDFGVSICG